MVFRRIGADEFDELVGWLIAEDIDYDIRCRNGVTFLGLAPHIWHRLDFSFRPRRLEA